MTPYVELALDALYQIILPIFLVLGVGFLVGRQFHLADPIDTSGPQQPDPERRSSQHNAASADVGGLRMLSKLVFYVFGPCLVFSSLSTSDVRAAEVGQIGLFAIVATLLMGAVAWALARLLHLMPHETSSLLLVAMFGNIGNYGLPLNELAFGRQALDRAVVYFVFSSVLLFSLGVAVAARARGSTPAQILARLVRVPVIHALWLAGLIRLGVLPLPGPILKSASILAQGAVPLMLLILGIQISRVRIRGNWRLVSLAAGLRLLFAPLIALLLAGLIGLTGLAQQVSIVEASMPSAVFTIVLAIEFDLAMDLASSVVFLTTLVSPLTLIPLIAYLR